jgi:hypothetical protein
VGRDRPGAAPRRQLPLAGGGSGSNRELYEALTGRRSGPDQPSAGLEVLDLRSQACRVELSDVAAVVHLLRKAGWTVSDFTVEGHRPQLRELHRRIEQDGGSVRHAQRYLIEASATG